MWWWWWWSYRYLNDVGYFGGFEQEDLSQLFQAMQSNFKAWVSGFAPLAVGADIDSTAVQEFGRTLFNIRPDIAFNVAKTIFQIDMRSILPQVLTLLSNFFRSSLSFCSCRCSLQSIWASVESSKNQFYPKRKINETNDHWVQVIVPCHILQSNKDLAVPVIVSDHLHHALGGPTIVEILQTEGHLPQLSSPDVVIPVLKRHLVGNIRA